MTRKDYIILARALAAARNVAGLEGARYGIDLATDYVANALAQDNPRFNRGRFLAAVTGTAIAFDRKPVRA